MKWSALRGSVNEAKDAHTINNRRLHICDVLKRTAGVQFFITTVGGYMNPRTREIKYWAGFFVAFSPTLTCHEGFLFNILHDCGLDPIAGGKKDDMTSSLSMLMKDHSNGHIIDFVCKCNQAVLAGHAREVLHPDDEQLPTQMGKEVLQSSKVYRDTCRYSFTY